MTGKTFTIISGFVNEHTFEQSYNSDYLTHLFLVDKIKSFNENYEDVTIYSNSLVVFYTINNCLYAYQKKSDVIPIEYHLSPEFVESIHYNHKGEKESLLVNVSNLTQLDEGVIGETLGVLEVEFNRIMVSSA